jgi:hypothetical protein
MRKIWEREALSNLVNLVLGACLLLSPWILGLVAEVAAG